MVVSQTIINAIKSASLSEFDSSSHIGFGRGTTSPSPLDTDLTDPVIRKAFDELPIKDDVAGTYDFATTLGLTEGNTNDLGEVGTFDSASAGDMLQKKLLTQVITKNSSKELSVGMRVTVTVTNI